MYWKIKVDSSGMEWEQEGEMLSQSNQSCLWWGRAGSQRREREPASCEHLFLTLGDITSVSLKLTLVGIFTPPLRKWQKLHIMTFPPPGSQFTSTHWL